MKQSTLIIICGALGLGALAAGICGVVRTKRSRRKPIATLHDLYEDNAASASSFLD